MVDIYVFENENSIKKLAEDIIKEMSEGKMPMLIPAPFAGNQYAPSKKKPFFRLTLAIPAKLFRKWEEGKTIGLGEIFDAKIYLFVIIDKNKLSKSFLESSEEENKSDV